MHNIRFPHREMEMKRIPEAGQKLRGFVSSNSLDHHIILQTCGRAELYYNGIDIKPLNGFVFENGERAFRHLLRVACSLESFGRDEMEILYQIRSAYQLARREGHCLSELGGHFEATIRVGRKAKGLTSISKRKVSIVSLALDHVQDLLGDLNGRAMVIGAGSIGLEVARSLKDRDMKKILVANGGYERAVELAWEIGAEAHSFSHLDELLNRAVICATSAPHLILTRKRVKAVHRKLLGVDFSMPRNVDETVGKLLLLRRAFR